MDARDSFSGKHRPNNAGLGDETLDYGYHEGGIRIALMRSRRLIQRDSQRVRHLFSAQIQQFSRNGRRPKDPHDISVESIEGMGC